MTDPLCWELDAEALERTADSGGSGFQVGHTRGVADDATGAAQSVSTSGSPIYEAAAPRKDAFMLIQLEKNKSPWTVVAGQESSMSSKLRTLVAEDEAAIAVALCSGLENVGFDVVAQVATGTEAIRMASVLKPDVVVMDIRMPEMDGITAADKIYEEHRIPVVILTAHPDQDLVERASEAGVFGYLLKPISPEGLRAAICTALSRAQAVADLNGRVDQLESNLRERKVVERAKGILMRKRGLTEEEAYLLLRRHSRDSRRPMADIAQSIIDAEELLSD